MLSASHTFIRSWIEAKSLRAGSQLQMRLGIRAQYFARTCDQAATGEFMHCQPGCFADHHLDLPRTAASGAASFSTMHPCYASVLRASDITCLTLGNQQPAASPYSSGVAMAP